MLYKADPGIYLQHFDGTTVVNFLLAHGSQSGYCPAVRLGLLFFDIETA